MIEPKFPFRQYFDFRFGVTAIRFFNLPHPPMVCVKLPESVLVIFHLFRETKLPNFKGLKGRRIDHFESRLLLALGCPVCVGQGSLLSAHVEF
jgi:hypothetical protein